jgi:hypothetical protein
VVRRETARLLKVNGYTLAAVNGHLRPLRESVAYVRDVGVGVPAMVIS